MALKGDMLFTGSDDKEIKVMLSFLLNVKKKNYYQGIAAAQIKKKQDLISRVP